MKWIYWSKINRNFVYVSRTNIDTYNFRTILRPSFFSILFYVSRTERYITVRVYICFICRSADEGAGLQLIESCPVDWVFFTKSFRAAMPRVCCCPHMWKAPPLCNAAPVCIVIAFRTRTLLQSRLCKNALRVTNEVSKCRRDHMGKGTLKHTCTPIDGMSIFYRTQPFIVHFLNSHKRAIYKCIMYVCDMMCICTYACVYGYVCTKVCLVCAYLCPHLYMYFKTFWIIDARTRALKYEFLLSWIFREISLEVRTNA